MQLTHSAVPLHPEKMGEKLGKEELEFLLLRNLITGAKMVLQPPSVVAVLEHKQ